MVATEAHFRKLAEGALRLATLSNPEVAKSLHVLAAEYLEKADALGRSGGSQQQQQQIQPKDEMSKEHKIERSLSGGYVAFWKDRPIYEKGRMKKFPTEEDARAFLAQCDEAGKIIHAT
jgi:hypothetical protein